MSDNKLFVITNKESNLSGVIRNIDENNVAIDWENDETQTLTNDELNEILDSDEFEVGEVELTEDAVNGDSGNVGETPAAASIHTHSTADASDGDADGNPKTRLDWIRNIIGGLANLDTATLTRIFDQQQALIGGEAERAGLANNSKNNMASISMKPSAAQGKGGVFTPTGVNSEVMSTTTEGIKLQKDEMDTLFAESDLTEEFKTKLTTLFETAVTVRLTEEIVKLQEVYETKLEESVNSLTKELVEGIDSYFEHIVEEWLTENEVAIESTLKSELTEEFIQGLKNLFQENYIEIPDERLDVYEALISDKEKLEADLNKSISENIEKEQSLKALKKDIIVSELAVGLTLPQREKLKALTESTDFDTEENFKNKVKTIKEGFVTKAVANSTIISENLGENVTDIEVDDPMMKAVLQAIKRTTGKN